MPEIRLTQPQKQSAAVVNNTGIPVPPGKQPSPKFVYVCYPRGWDYVEGFGFLPRLKRVLCKPGVNGVNGRGDMTKVLAGVVAKGGTVIQPSDHRLGEYQGYVQYYDTNDGRKWYCDFCATVTILPDGGIFWGVTEKNARNKFREYLRDNKIVPGLAPEIFEVLMAGKTRQLDQMGSAINGNPTRQFKYDEFQKSFDKMRDWWNNSQDKKTKAPAKRKTASKVIKKIATMGEDNV